MKLTSIVAALVLPAATHVAAQCPNLALAVAAPACSSSGAPLPTLKESVQPTPSLSQPCKVVFELTTPPFCCNIFVAGRLLALGVDAGSLPLPGGCTLNVLPLAVLAFPAPSGASGTSVLEIPLPAAPSTLGITVLAEAAVVRFDTMAMATYVDTTQTHKLAFVP
ncbi:MAG: hypothetical protein EPO68_17140 [Planctomycetota bacterium]|nr:MAG: hypothetical protein EPO68_17140 [Planctomycetota bacterium]